jgi:hypothetical protein
MTRMGMPHHMGRGRKRIAPLLSLAAVSLAVLGFASPALALKPTGEWAQFGDCPLSNPSVTVCVFAQTTSGEFKIGSTTVPLTKTTTLQGGLEVIEEGTKENFVNAADGNTLSKTPQTVPGGLLKIMSPEFFPEPLKKIFNEFINKGITGVSATAELVGEVKIDTGKIVGQNGAGLTLPLRVHLENEFLGSKCFVGSKAHPVTVEFTTGTTSPPPPNTPITGAVGEIEIKGGGTILVLKKNSLVNNSFAAPEAEGCGSQILFGLFTGIIDSAVDSQLGLPSAAGHNTAILNGNQELAEAEAVKKSEK